MRMEFLLFDSRVFRGFGQTNLNEHEIRHFKVYFNFGFKLD